MKEETVKLIVILLGVASTLGIYSILYKENKVFRFFEHDDRRPLVDAVCNPSCDDVLHDLFKAELMDEPPDIRFVSWSYRGSDVPVICCGLLP